jgi:hypothetical protein
MSEQMRYIVELLVVNIPRAEWSRAEEVIAEEWI